MGVGVDMVGHLWIGAAIVSMSLESVGLLLVDYKVDIGRLFTYIMNTTDFLLNHHIFHFFSKNIEVAA